MVTTAKTNSLFLILEEKTCLSVMLDFLVALGVVNNSRNIYTLCGSGDSLCADERAAKGLLETFHELMVEGDTLGASIQ
jgi:hypothetical protein